MSGVDEWDCIGSTPTRPCVLRLKYNLVQMRRAEGSLMCFQEGLKRPVICVSVWEP